MKTVLLLLLSCISIAFSATVKCTSGGCATSSCKFGYTNGNDGKPSCSDASQLKSWRNNNDPVHYWVCEAVGKPAVSKICSTNTLYLESAGKCVCVDDWVWTPPCDPEDLSAGEGGSATGGNGGGCS
ncbi:uncharacterized protein LOC119648374 isoform X2 [Hermetia illucens]|uniref:uncharacterized protein LOC119648374 isoform X2 n=1 Tax=Hermetia illucens TaxID=343691 RepID=UPI0018CC4D30|nr:uncharacterized protein LOC119648374 isoform X2 [Hermetia illucens]